MLEMMVLKAEPEPIKINLKRTALLVIDMQNAFLSEGGLFDILGFDVQQFRKIIVTIKKIINVWQSNGLKIVYIVNRHSTDMREIGGPESSYWHKSKHMQIYREKPEQRDKLVIRGTWGSEIIQELKPRDNDLVVEKPRHSAFNGTDLDTTLRSFNINYLLFTGIATNICVEHSLRDALNLGYFNILLSDATVAVGPPFMQDATIANVKFIYGWVTNSENFIKELA